MDIKTATKCTSQTVPPVLIQPTPTPVQANRHTETTRITRRSVAKIQEFTPWTANLQMEMAGTEATLKLMEKNIATISLLAIWKLSDLNLSRILHLHVVLIILVFLIYFSSIKKYFRLFINGIPFFVCNESLISFYHFHLSMRPQCTANDRL